MATLGTTMVIGIMIMLLVNVLRIGSSSSRDGSPKVVVVGVVAVVVAGVMIVVVVAREGGIFNKIVVVEILEVDVDVVDVHRHRGIIVGTIATATIDLTTRKIIEMMKTVSRLYHVQSI